MIFLHCCTIQLAKPYEKILIYYPDKQCYNIILIYVGKILSKPLEKVLGVRLNNTPPLSRTWGWHAKSIVYEW